MNTKALRQKILDLAIHGKLVPPACRQAGKSLENIPAEKEGQWFVYVIECVDGSFYKGFTTDLIKRYKQDCAGIGAEWTKNHKPKQLFYWEIHYSEKSAIEREKYLESGCGREWFKNEVVDKPENWESATVLLEKIRAEKAEKIKKGLPAGRRGELKADKKDSFIFVGSDKRHYEQFADGTVKDIEDEIPFEVPEGWAWCRLGNIGKWQSGTTPNKKNLDYYKNGTIPWLLTGDLNDGLVTEIPNCITEKALKETSLKINPIGSVCIAMYGATIGKLGILNTPATTNQACCVCYEFYGINNKYLFYFLKEHKEEFIQQGFGGAQPNISKEKIVDTFIPLPPLSEQECIVKSIETYFEQIDSLEENKYDLQTAIKQAKSKILNLAIHGKLVPQDPNDEPAEELLKRISTSDNRPYEKIEEGDIPFEIPPSWKWTTIKNIVNYIGDGDWIESKDQSDKGIRLIQTGNIGFGTFKDKEGKYHYISENTFSRLGCNEIFEGDILISRLPEPVGRACILPKVPERMITAVDCTIIRLNEELFQKELFVYYTISNKYLELIKENCTGTTRLRISRSNLEKIFIPIPPLNEQKRILNRIKKLFETLDEIILNLV